MNAPFANSSGSTLMPTLANGVVVFTLAATQGITTLSLATMFSELRKYRVGLTLANQHISQLGPEIRDAIFGNAGSLIVFRVGAADAALLSREFGYRFSPADFTGLPRHNVYARLLIDGQYADPFSAQTLAELDPSAGS